VLLVPLFGWALASAATTLPVPLPRVGLTAQVCPLNPRQRRRGDTCLGAQAPNWRIAFLYPAAAARLAPLDALLRSRAATAASHFATDVDFASRNPDQRVEESHIYTLAARTPQLLGLTSLVSGAGGGAHGWFRHDSLLWDVAAAREVRFAELFRDPRGAWADLADRLCPVVARARRRVSAHAHGRLDVRCPKPPFNAAPISFSGKIRWVKVTMDELDGYAGGTYEVWIPVTARLAGFVNARYRNAFAATVGRVRVCNANFPACVRGDGRNRR
jgi:hypothetical protein